MIVTHYVRRTAYEEWSVRASTIEVPYSLDDWQRWTTHKDAKDEAEAREIADELRQTLPPDIYKVEIIHVKTELADIGEDELIRVDRGPCPE